jgi:transporter family-2 protein
VLLKSGEKVFGLELLSAFSGVLIAAQSKVNGALSVKMGDSLEAAIVGFLIGLLFITLISLTQPKLRSAFKDIFKAVKEGQMHPWTLVAGALGASFVAIQTYVVPIAGVALFTVASLAGQTAISLWVDQLGLSGGVKSVITKRRVIAALITVFAVLVSTWDRLSMSNFSVLAIGLALLAGTWVGFQRALNGKINSFSKRAFATAQLNFITGTSFLFLLLLLRSIFTDHSMSNFTTAPWWMFLGGLIGVLYIALSSHVVQHLGVLEFTLFSVGGMLIGSLLIDLIFPTPGTVISPYLIVGIALTYLGVIANGQSRFSRK